MRDQSTESHASLQSTPPVVHRCLRTNGQATKQCNQAYLRAAGCPTMFLNFLCSSFVRCQVLDAVLLASLLQCLITACAVIAGAGSPQSSEQGCLLLPPLSCFACHQCPRAAFSNHTALRIVPSGELLFALLFFFRGILLRGLCFQMHQVQGFKGLQVLISPEAQLCLIEHSE